MKYFDKLYNRLFYEYGINVRIDENHTIWIYEISFTLEITHQYLEEKTARIVVQCASYIDKKFKKEVEKNEDNKIE